MVLQNLGEVLEVVEEEKQGYASGNDERSPLLGRESRLSGWGGSEGGRGITSLTDTWLFPQLSQEAN